MVSEAQEFPGQVMKTSSLEIVKEGINKYLAGMNSAYLGDERDNLFVIPFNLFLWFHDSVQLKRCFRISLPLWLEKEFIWGISRGGKVFITAVEDVLFICWWALSAQYFRTQQATLYYSEKFKLMGLTWGIWHNIMKDKILRALTSVKQ